MINDYELINNQIWNFTRMDQNENMGSSSTGPIPDCWRPGSHAPAVRLQAPTVWDGGGGGGVEDHLYLCLMGDDAEMHNISHLFSITFKIKCTNPGQSQTAWIGTNSLLEHARNAFVTNLWAPERMCKSPKCLPPQESGSAHDQVAGTPVSTTLVLLILYWCDSSPIVSSQLRLRTDSWGARTVGLGVLVRAPQQSVRPCMRPPALPHILFCMHTLVLEGAFLGGAKQAVAQAGILQMIGMLTL